MLSQFLVSELFAFLLIFCRIGSAIMLLPGFGETYVAARIRLLFALLVSVILTPIIDNLPPVPTSSLTLMYVMLAEILIGLFLGGISRMLMATLHMAGTIIAFEASLSSSLTQNMSSFQGQDTTIGNLLTMAAVILMFTMDVHHIMLAGLANSYTLFSPGQFPLMGDIAHHATKMMSTTFKIAVQLAAPNIVINMSLYLGAGILSRLMPTMQILAIIAAPQILLNFFIIMICFSAIMLWFMDHFKTTLSALLP
jgi:flagellar biosynthesis protein FliR